MLFIRSDLWGAWVIDSRDIPGEFKYNSSVRDLERHLTEMQLLRPDHPHPDIELLKKLFSHCTFAQDQSAVTPPTPSLEDTVRSVLTDVISQPLSDMSKTLDEHSKRNTIVEINT